MTVCTTLWPQFYIRYHHVVNISLPCCDFLPVLQENIEKWTSLSPRNDCSSQRYNSRSSDERSQEKTGLWFRWCWWNKTASLLPGETKLDIVCFSFLLWKHVIFCLEICLTGIRERTAILLPLSYVVLWHHPQIHLNSPICASLSFGGIVLSWVAARYFKSSFFSLPLQIPST